MCKPEQGFYGDNPPLSPQAQAIMVAAVGADNGEGSLYSLYRAVAAAALRALAHHAGENVFTYDDGKFAVVREAALRALAHELEQCY
jgi:hypothetical protein